MVQGILRSSCGREDKAGVARRALEDALKEVAVDGFYGQASVTFVIQDGHLQSVTKSVNVQYRCGKGALCA